MPPSALALDHFVVPVVDAAAAHRFYGDTLSLPLVDALSGGDWGGRRWLMMVFALGTAGQHLVAAAFDGPIEAAPPWHPRDARHVALAVPTRAAWEAWRARLEAAKAEAWVEDHGTQRSLYVVDPSANVIELTTPPTASLDDRSTEARRRVDAWLAGAR